MRGGTIFGGGGKVPVDGGGLGEEGFAGAFRAGADMSKGLGKVLVLVGLRVEIPIRRVGLRLYRRNSWILSFVDRDGDPLDGIPRVCLLGLRLAVTVIIRGR